MFRRFQIIELFFGNKEISFKEWVDVKENLPDLENGIFKVKLSNGVETDAFFCSDKCTNLHKNFSDKFTYWWHRREKEPIYNVTHWGREE